MSQHEILSSLPDERTNADAITVRSPVVQDGHARWRVVKRSGVLQENSCYAYDSLREHRRCRRECPTKHRLRLANRDRLRRRSACIGPRYPVFLAGHEVDPI